MVEQLLSNTNEMLPYTTVPNSEFSTAEFGHLNMAKVCKEVVDAG
jgi:hypothetical protein